MKIASVILNTLLMCVFAFASSFALMKLENDIGYSQNPRVVKTLAPLVRAVLQVKWLCTALPCIWIIGAIGLVILAKRDLLKTEHVQLHTSLTLYVGITLLVLFALAGIVPYIPLTLGGR